MANQHILLSFSKQEFEQIIRNCIKAELQNGITQSPAPPKAGFISRKEVVRILGISIVTLGDYCKRGMIPSYRIGCRVLFKEHEVIASVAHVKTIKHKRGLDL